MAVIDQKITEEYAAYHGDCCEVVPDIPDESIHFSIYSPPFYDLFNYSSSNRDMSNCIDYDQFMEHYAFLVKNIERVLMPGRLVAVHCKDLKEGKGMKDFPGDIIALHKRLGFYYHSRHCVWRDPLLEVMKTRVVGLTHKQIVKDATVCRIGTADYILVFRKKGENSVKVKHPLGLSDYMGENQPPLNLVRKYKDWPNPKTNKLAHWIWQRYASPFWDDIDPNGVLQYKQARDAEDEKHVCPLQLQIIARCLTLWTNPGEKVLSPFMGVGSEIYQSVKMGRKGIGVELKKSYYRQALRHLRTLGNNE